jgi:hypothetical protein
LSRRNRSNITASNPAGSERGFFIFCRHPDMFQVGIIQKELEDADLKHVSMTSWGGKPPK